MMRDVAERSRRGLRIGRADVDDKASRVAPESLSQESVKGLGLRLAVS